MTLLADVRLGGVRDPNDVHSRSWRSSWVRRFDATTLSDGPHIGLLRVVGAYPGRWIDLDDIAGEMQVRVISHGVSRTVRKNELLVARIMEGPPAHSLWGPVATLTRESGGVLMDLLRARITSSSLQDSPTALATAMHLEAREITMLLAPGLACSGELRLAA